MLLLPVATLRDDLGFDDMDDFNNAAASALSVATSTLGAMLETKFEQELVTDLFYIERPGVQRATSVSTEFRLSQGFVSEVFSMGRTSDLTEAFQGFAGTILKKEEGFLVDHQTFYNREYMQVTYMKGFTIDPDAPGQFMAEDVPQWLRDACVLQAKINLGTSPSFQQAGITQDTKALGTQLRDIIIPHLRYNPSALRPI